MILRRYINEESPRRYINEESPDLSANRPGFLNVAMNHLKEKTNRPRHSKR